MKEYFWIGILVLLIFLSSASDLYGRNVPKVVWWISFIAAGSVGFVAGVLLAPFPENILVGGLISIGTIISFFVSRAIRNKHEK